MRESFLWGWIDWDNPTKEQVALVSIRNVYSRHVEAIILMTYCGDKTKNEG